MLKKVLSSILIVALLSGIFITTNPYFVNTANAEEYRDGFCITPESSDSTGVKTDSTYILKSQNDISLDDLKNILSIDGEPAPVITKESTCLFSITPSRQFDQNKLYTFRIKHDNGNETTWVFQTCAAFKIQSVFPSDKTTNVPTNTGIEIYFSHEDYEDIDSYFEISPPTKGTFERHKKVAVFVPESLKDGTLYTVTIKKGLKLKGTAYSLTDDYTFMFETAPSSQQPENPKGYFSYNKSLNEYAPAEKPYIPFYYYINQDSVKGSIKVQTSVYSFGSIDSFINALNTKAAVPVWANLNYSKNAINPVGLSKVLAFEQEFSKNPDNSQFIVIPQALPAGYYLVNSQWDSITFQTFIEVTDIGMYIMKGGDKTLIWLNDLSTKKPIEGASISLVGKTEQYSSGADGIAYFDSPKDDSSADENNDSKYFKITTKDNKTAILSYYSYMGRYYGGSGANLYWNYLYLDRTLYKPDDTVSFWGLVKNRYSDENVGPLTVEIGQGYRYLSYFKAPSPGHLPILPASNEPAVEQTISAENGIFKGDIKLPALEPGGYQFTVKKGDDIISSSYITVENYTKPPYDVEIAKDKEAIFPGQQVNFNIKASFFEGTGVPGLSVDYNINNNTGIQPVSAVKSTDANGNIAINYAAEAQDGAQGENQVSLFCHATLPEIGETTQNSSVRLFVNDVNVSLTSENKDKKGIINATVNKIVLDRLNNGTAKDSSDYLGDAVSGKTLSGTIYKNTWVQVPDGQYYDFINKVTQKRYRYELHKDEVKSFSMTTGSDGKASFQFDAPDVQNGYYTAEIKTTDNSGRNMKFETYIGGYSIYMDGPYDDTRYHLDGGKDSYNIGDKVDLTFKKGNQDLGSGSYLFIKNQNGIRDYALSDSSHYSFDVAQKDVPNMYVTGVYFNGITYVESEIFNASYNYKEKNLLLEATSDKTSYMPGEEAVIKITAKDTSGIPKKAIVNASIVDEALFKLSEQDIDTLSALYSAVPSGIDFTYQSHVNSGTEAAGNGMVEMKSDSQAAAPTAANVKAKNSDSFGGYNKADTAYVREDFRDTAHFETITLDDNGYGELKFKLPDNVTSWRITLSGVTTDLLAGSNKAKLNVSLPFFINYTLNSTYLKGDKPVLGVNAYGSQLEDGEDVTFEVSSESDPQHYAKAEGKAFERVNIPLWEMDEGKDNILIKAYTSDGLSDSMKQTVNVVSTYHQIDKAVYYDLTPGLNFEGGSAGNTKLIFADKSRGAFLPELTSLLYTNGNRIDQKLAARTASELIEKYFKQNDMDTTDTSFKVSDYQRDDGGIALLPYGSSDLDVSAKLSSLIKDEVDTQKLKEYFYQAFEGDSPGLKGNALYGLAVLREPVLLDLDKASEVQNASIKDLLYIALAYCELGENSKAENLYNLRILNHIDEYKPYYRVDAGTDNDDILECTSLASILASKLDMPQKKGLYDYCVENYTKDILVNIEKLLYISGEIEKYSEGSSKFSYSLYGKEHTMTLTGGRSLTLSIPSQRLNEFRIDSVEGAISMVSVFKTGLTDPGKADSNLKVNRMYSIKDGPESNTFKQNDIVKVELTYDIGAKALDGGYEITDYLPSGLKPIENPFSMGVDPGIYGYPYYRNIDGQKVTFYVYKGWEEKTPLVYYARVISPGTYKADGAVIQGIASKDSVSVGEAEMVEIK